VKPAARALPPAGADATLGPPSMRAHSLPLFAIAATLFLACEDGPYSAPPGDFYCGSTTCEIDTQYCVTSPGTDGATEAVCAAAPDACEGTPTCACVTSCGGACQQAGDGSITVTCSH
jgi:hypothetical protein